MKIYGTPLSSFARKVLIIAHLKGIDVDFKIVRPHADDAGFRAASPFGLVPAIEDAGFTLSDSSAIALYLERRYPAPPLLPSEPEAYGRALWLEEFGDSILGKACGGYVAQLAYIPKLYNRPTDQAVVKKLQEEDIPAALTYLETVMPSTGYLTGTDLGIADASVISTLMGLELVSYQIDEKRWPKIAAYMEKALAHPAVAGENERMIQTAKTVGIL